ncbi:unnamed protein product [Clonostachys solani]|uniref:Membrane-associated protein n=1 Tax=Clonostachys solani TaxID=160281 RepID=A0A9N9YZV2_9HYPO|nr:unnamed protein product [Clonostachys solani]
MAPLVLPFILTLVSFPVARMMIRANEVSTQDSNEASNGASNETGNEATIEGRNEVHVGAGNQATNQVSNSCGKGDGDQGGQPTPYQLALMLRILSNASLSSVWRCITYVFSRPKKRVPFTPPLTVMMWMLIIGSVLSTLVFATDTWFHLTMKTVSLTQLEPTIFNNASFGLSTNCTNVAHSFDGGCTLNPAATATFVMDGETSLSLLANISSAGIVQQIVDGIGSKTTYLGLPPNSFNADKDYTAMSFGVSTQCAPITARCISDNDISGPGAKYNCDFGMEGYISTTDTNSMIMTYFTDMNLSDNTTGTISMPNPYSFGAVVSVNQNLGWHRDLIESPGITTGLHGSTLFVLLCNATVLDLKYTSINGTITSSWSQTSNSSTTNIIMGTQGYTKIGDPYILQRTSLDVWQSHTAQEVADKFAVIYSQIALAAAGGAFIPMPAVEAQLRSSILVAKVPKAPLACLLLANLLLVLLGIILTIFAFLALTGDVGDLQARLSIDALVAAHFETNWDGNNVGHIDDMFEERKGSDGPRVRAERIYRGWRLASYFRRPSSSSHLLG